MQPQGGSKRRGALNGGYILEFAAVLAIALPLVIGAVDINNALYGYQVARHSAETALRCLYPINGRCADSSGLTPPTNLYHWYQERVDTPQFVRRVQYSLDATWRSHPVYTYNRFAVTVLDAVEFEAATAKYSATPTMHPATVELQALAEIGAFPFLDGTIAAPRMENQRGSTGSFTRRTVSLPAQRTVSQSNPRVMVRIDPGEIIPLMRQGEMRKLACVGLNGSTPTLLRSCRDYNGSTIRIGVWVEGRAAGGSAGQLNHLRIALSGQSSSLGGQYFASPGSTASAQENFDPRGFTSASEVMLRSIGRGGTLPSWATSPISIATDQSATLSIERGDSWDPNATYEVTAVHVYAPNYGIVSLPASAEIPTCTAKTVTPLSVLWQTDDSGPSVGPQGAYATALPGMKIAAHTPTLLIKPSSFRIESGTTIVKSEKRVEIGEFISEAAAREAFPDTCYALTAGEAGSPQMVKQQCPEGNFGGVSEEDRIAQCPPESDTPPAALKNVRWSEKNIVVGGDDAGWRTTWEKARCDTPFSLSPPPNLVPYKRYHLPHWSDFDAAATVQVATPMISDGASCSDIQIVRRHLGRGSAPADSFFGAPHPEITMQDIQCVNRFVLQAAAASGIPSFAELRTEASFVDEVRADVAEDPCIVSRRSPTVTERKRIAENMPEGAVPPCEPGFRCQREIARRIHAAQDPSAGLRLDYARQVALNQIAATYPRGRLDCPNGSGEPDCVEVTPRIDGDVATVRSQIMVQSFLFGGETFPIEHTTSRILERSLAQ